MIQDNNWEDLIVTRDSNGYYHKKPDGTPAYEERYKWVDDFSGGLARVVDFDENWFHIKPDGQSAYDERYKFVWNFSEGLAWASDGTGWFHIRTDGTPAYKQRYRFVGNFSDGLAVVEDFNANKFKINKKGERVN